MASKRRSRGEGSIGRRSDGLWMARITLPSGKRKTKYGKTQKEVRDWLSEMQTANRQGTWSDSQNVTVGAFLERYLADVVAHTLRPKTQESYNLLTRKHLIPELGNIRLLALRPSHLQSFYSAKLAEEYSKRTVQYLHSILHKALSQAVRWDMVPRNVADSVDAPRPSKTIPALLTEAQALSFLDGLKDDPLYPLWLTLFSTGMRKGEVLGLRWMDVDLDQAVIHVTQTAGTVHKKGTVISEPKTEQSKRSIILPSQLVVALKAHKESTKRYQGFEAFVDQDLVFSTKRGTPFGSRNLLKYFQEALEAQGLPKVSIHSLRHLHATLLLKAGLHPKIVQSRLGHSDIGQTMNTYSHVIAGMDDKAAEEVSRMLSSVP